MNNQLSKIWKQVRQYTQKKDLADEGFCNLMEAAKYVMCSDEEQYSFCRNRELIDISRRFRCFQYQKRNYVIKLFVSNEIPVEYYNALRIKQILEKYNVELINIVLPVFIQSGHKDQIGLLQEDYGFTLYENINNCSNKFDINEIIEVFGLLLKLGVEWSGFLPRNMFFKNNKWYCIDFEDVIFHNNTNCTIRDLTVFKLLLGWGQIYGKCQVQKALDKILAEREVVFSELDSFETALSELLDSTSESYTRSFGFDITYESELPVKSPILEKNCLNSMDIGHLMEDILNNNYLSVWYTISTAKIRKDFGDDYFASFLNCFEHLMIVWLSETNIPIQNNEEMKQLQQISVCLLLYSLSYSTETLYYQLSLTKRITEVFDLFELSLPCFAKIKHFQKLRSSKGWKAAIERSQCIHEFLNDIYKIITISLQNLSDYDLLLRGSCGQGLMTIKSDVDFEISNNHKPNGFLAAEKLLATILRLFDIDCDCSTDRPTEIDLISTQGYTRDFHEWSELIIPGSKTINKGWNNNLYNVENVWRYYSDYETQKHNLSTKYLFFQIRAIIERYAIKHSILQSQIPEILNALSGHIPNEDVEQLVHIAHQCLNCYESNTVDSEEIINLKLIIDNMYMKLGICYRNEFVP